MDDIDYEALAKASVSEYRATWARSGSVDWEQVARAVVVAYQAQQRAKSRNVRSWAVAELLHREMSAQWGSHVPVGRDGDWSQLSDAAMRGYHDIAVRIIAGLSGPGDEENANG